MVPSPTVLASSTTTPGTPASAPVTAKIPVASLLIAVVVGVVIATLGVGGVVYYLAHTGHLPVQQGAAGQKTEVIAVTTHAMVLEPLLVNLSDAGGSSYLRMSMTLRVADPVSQKG